MNITQVSDGITTPHSQEAAIPSTTPSKEQHDSMSTTTDVTTPTLQDCTNTTPVPTAIPDHPVTMPAEKPSPTPSSSDETKALIANAIKIYMNRYFTSFDNEGNGDCIAACFSLDKFNNEDHTGDVRNWIADAMIKNEDVLSEFFPGDEDGVATYANNVTRVRGKWLDQVDLFAYSLHEKRVVAVIDTSGNHEKVLYHPQDPEEEDEIWNRVNRFAPPIYLVRINEQHYMLLRPNYMEGNDSEEYFHVKVSEKLYLSNYNRMEQEVLIKEGAMLDNEKNRLYVYETQLWNKEYQKFSPGSMTELQTNELINRISNRDIARNLNEHMEEYERYIGSEEEVRKTSNYKQHEDGNKVSLFALFNTDSILFFFAIWFTYASLDTHLNYITFIDIAQDETSRE